MDSRIISVDSLSSSSAELQELMNMLGDPALESEFEEVDLREHAPQPTPTQESQDSNPIQVVERTMLEDLTEAEDEAARNSELEETSSEDNTQETPIDNGPTIPESAITRLLDESTSRFSSAEWFKEVKTKDITLAGLGGIGSWTALLFGRLKPNRIIIYDFDTVDTVNMAGQLFSCDDIGSTKVYAVNRLINRYCGFHSVVGMEEAITRSALISPVAVCGFDNMEARKTLYTLWKNIYKGMEEAIFIDGRLSAEEFQVFCITGKDLFLMNRYEKDWLFDDAEAEATLCSYKQTSFCANMIASVMTNLFVNFITNLCDPVIPRALPFMTSYDASTMMLRTTMQ